MATAKKAPAKSAAAKTAAPAKKRTPTQFYESAHPSPVLVGRRSVQSPLPRTEDQQTVGLHQGPEAAGQRQQAHDQRRRQAQSHFRRRSGVHVRNGGPDWQARPVRTAPRRSFFGSAGFCWQNNKMPLSRINLNANQSCLHINIFCEFPQSQTSARQPLPSPLSLHCVA